MSPGEDRTEPSAPAPSDERGRWYDGRSARIAAAILAFGVVALVIFFALFDWNWLKGPIERAALARTGRELKIEGPLAGQWRWRPRFSAEKVRFANPAWANEPWFLEAERVAFTLPLASLFRRPIAIEDIELTGARLALEVSAQGQRSWLFDREQKDSGSAVALGSLRVVDGAVRYLDPTEHSDLRVTASTDAEQRLSGKAAGTYRRERIDATVSSETPRLDRQDADGLAIQAKGRVGDGDLQLSGKLGPGYGLVGAVLDITLAGSDLSRLRPIFQAALPATPPYRLRGAVTLRDGGASIRFASSKVGDSALSGELDIAGKSADGRPRVSGKLVADPLDFDDLGPLVGTPPATRPGETASAEQRAQAERIRATRRVLPDARLDTSLWPKVDFDVTLDAARAVNAPSFPIDGFAVRVRLENGRLALAPLDVRIANGRYRGELSMEAQKAGVYLKSTGKFAGVQLARLAPQTKTFSGGFGEMNGTVALEGVGPSFARLLGDAKGNVALVVGTGQVSNLFLEIVGLDAFESLKYILGRDKMVRLRCAVAGLPIEHGIISAGAVVIDTDDTKIVIGGNASLRDESLDLIAYPTSRDWSLVTLRTPLHIRGTFARPSIQPEMSGLAAKGLGAVLLGFVNPFAALLPLMETGIGPGDKDSADGKRPAGNDKAGPTTASCGRLIEAVRLGVPGKK